MNEAFDPYREWLGVSAETRRPDYYELLGLRCLENDQEIIKHAADQRAGYLQGLLPGEHGLLARRILNEIAAARSCLLDPRAKAAYDRQLREPSSEPSGDRPLPPSAAPLATPLPPAVPPEPPPTADPPSQDRQSEAPVAQAPETRPRPTATAPGRRPGQGLIRPPPRCASAAAAEPPPGLDTLDESVNAPRVPMISKMTLESVLEELDQAMQRCRELYLSYVPPGREILKGAALQTALSQDRLHKYLLVKICATVAEADGRWTYEEQRCAAAVLKHVGIPFSHNELEKTVDFVKQQAVQLDWQQLIRPYRADRELRDKMAELQTVVLRAANLIAKADGSLVPREKTVLQQIQEELRPDRQLVPIEESWKLEAETNSMPREVEKLWRRADHKRRQAQSQSASVASLLENLRRLDELVGLRQVKQEIRDVAYETLRPQQRRKAAKPSGLHESHLVFVGREGTGKTAAARLLSRILAAVGALKHGRLIEVNPVPWTDLDTGEAASRMDADFAQAIGGTLLIDHAGELLSSSAQSLTAARRVLLQRMAKHRSQLVVILSDRSDRLLPIIHGRSDLASAFTRHLHFPDYNVSELGQIFQRFCDRNHYQVARPAQVKLLVGLQWRLERDGELFGNGHLVRQVFEDAVYCLGSRIAGISPLTEGLLTTLEDGDIVIDGVPPGVWRDLSDPARTFTIYCPGCASVNQVGSEMLGIRVECKRCHHRFICAWGEP